MIKNKNTRIFKLQTFLGNEIKTNYMSESLRRRGRKFHNSNPLRY